jgi:GT2 family glycosyltransferase
MKIIVHLVTWEGEQYLPGFMDTFRVAAAPHNVQLRIAINGSTDGSVAWLAEHAASEITVKNNQNIGFSPAHNQLFRATFDRLDPEEEALIVLANQDILFAPTFFTELLAAAERWPQAAAYQPKLWRAVWREDGTIEKTTSLDSTGLAILRGYTFVDRAQGEEDAGQWEEGEVAGVNGALCVVRASAARAVSYGAGEVFDDTFFAYKEDADLSWRLARRGCTMVYVPQVTAWHYRGLPGVADRTFWQRFADRRSRSAWRAAYSSRNQLLMVIKNFRWSDVWQHGFTLLVVEVARLSYGLLLEPATRRLLLASGGAFRQAWQRRKVY